MTKKTTMKFLLTAIFGLAMLASCQESEGPGGAPDKRINITPTITRATEVSFEAGDRIGLTITKLASGSVYADNALMTYDASVFTGNLNWYAAETDVSILTAYYPYSSAGAPSSFSVSADQTTGYGNSDLLASRKTGVTPTAGSVAMTFRHMLAKMVINVTNESGADISSVVLKGSIPTANIDFEALTATVDSNAAAADITAQQVTANTLYRAIVVPQAVAFTIAVGISDDKTFTEVLASATLAQGGQYSVNVSVLPDGIVVTLSGDIENWTDEGEIGPGDEEDPGDEEGEDPEPPVTGSVELDKLYGYATAGSGTTGGAGASQANIHHFDDGDCFREWLKLREKAKSQVPAIVYLSGTFNKDQGRASSSPWFDIKDMGNMSIYGINGFTMDRVGLFLVRANNIIIRNLYIKMPKADNGADGISMQDSHNVWVDHCTFESLNQTKDYEDGSCDITHATYNVTVSWCRFIKTQKSCLVGHSNSASADAAITATFHHNFFDGSSSRHPRVRFGRAHVYNNFFDRVTTYGVGSAYGAKVLVEDNYFEAVTLPTDICTYPAKKSGSSWVSNLQGSVAGFLYERNNTYNNKPADAGEVYPFTNVEYTAYNGSKLSTPLAYDGDFKPSYSYIVDKVEDIPTIVPSSAGTSKLPNFATAPIAVDNGGIEAGTGGGDGEEEDGGMDLANDWRLLSNGAASASAICNGGSLSLTACGKFESTAQTFGVVYREVTGDFTITAQIESYNSTKTGNQSQAGLVLSPDMTATANNFIHAVSGIGHSAADVYGYYYSNRLTSANAAKGGLTAPTASTEGAKPILKLVRSGNDCSASYSLDGGATFGPTKKVTIAELAETLHVGIIVNSGDSKALATAVVSNVIINGDQYDFTEE